MSDPARTRIERIKIDLGIIGELYGSAIITGEQYDILKDRLVSQLINGNDYSDTVITAPMHMQIAHKRSKE